MARIGLIVCLVSAVVCLSLVGVEANQYDLGKMITWVDPKVSSLLGVMWRYKNYGCNCNAAGGRPLDQVDCCCRVHNECYDKLKADGTCTSNPFNTGYHFKKVTEGGQTTIQCTSTPTSSCEHQLCLCDAVVADCFAKTGDSYTSKHKSYKYSQCDKTNTKADFCKL